MDVMQKASRLKIRCVVRVLDTVAVDLQHNQTSCVSSIYKSVGTEVKLMSRKIYSGCEIGYSHLHVQSWQNKKRKGRFFLAHLQQITPEKTLSSGDGRSTSDYISVPSTRHWHGFMAKTQTSQWATAHPIKFSNAKKRLLIRLWN